MNFSLPEVQQALLDALTAHFDAENQVVQFGLPTKIPHQLERFYVEADEDGMQRARRSAFTTETYNLRVWLEVRQFGSTPAQFHACCNRRWELADELAEVAHSKDFKGYLQEDQDIIAFGSSSGPVDKGFVAYTRIQIPVRVRG